MSEHQTCFLRGNFALPLNGGAETSTFHLAVQTVNTVYNRQQLVSAFNASNVRYKRIQSGTVKAATSVFVTDKKRCETTHGLKGTRIEFTRQPHFRRSSNYTNNNRPLYHALIHKFFELVSLSQGECIFNRSPPTLNNINYTTCLYGVTNPFAFSSSILTDRVQFHTPFFFPSVNLRDRDSSLLSREKQHQIFASRYINSQKLNPGDVNHLGTFLGPLSERIEADEPLNRYCCQTFLRDSKFLNTANKVALLYYNELFYLDSGVDPTTPSVWRDQYTAYITRRMREKKNDFFPQVDQRTGQLESKNPEFVHLVPHFIYLCSTHPDGLDLLEQFARRMGALGRGRTLYELQLVVKETVGFLHEIDPESSGRVWCEEDGDAVVLCGPERDRRRTVGTTEAPDKLRGKAESVLRDRIRAYCRRHRCFQSL